jgi:hypothetical protein
VGEIDIAWRRLLREVPESAIRIAFPRRRLRVMGPASDASVDRPRQLTTDNLFVVRDGRRELILHLEIELKWRPSLPLRLFDYASSAHVLTRRPVITVVLLLRRGGRPPRSLAEYRVPVLGTRDLVFPYHVIALASCDARAMKQRLPPEGWPFLVAMRGGGTPRSVGALAREIGQHASLSPPRKEMALQLLFVVAAAMLGDDAARSIFVMDSIIGSPGVQALIRHYRHEGRQEEARSTLMRILSRRGFAITDEVRQRVEGERDLSRLEAWLDAAVTAVSIDDVFACASPRGA